MRAKILPILFSFSLLITSGVIDSASAQSNPMVFPSGESTLAFNENCYAFIPSSGITFIDAFNDAQTKSVNGIPGHLATFESSAEEAVSDSTGGNAQGWIGYTADGAYAPGPFGGDGFGWVDGSPLGYSNWNAGEPSGDGPYTENNQAGGDPWNDVNNIGFNAAVGYYVEFEDACPIPVGGYGLQIDTTALLLASAQSLSLWMIPVIAGIGIGVFVIKRRI